MLGWILCVLHMRCVFHVCTEARAHSLGPGRLPAPPGSACAPLSGKQGSFPPDPSPAVSPAPPGRLQTLTQV